MRTIPRPVPTYARCGHCSLPDALHTQDQRIACEKRLLADLSRSWPRKVPTPAEREALVAKKVRAAIDALADVRQLVELAPEERDLMLAAVDVLGAKLPRQAADIVPC